MQKDILLGLNVRDMVYTRVQTSDSPTNNYYLFFFSGHSGEGQRECIALDPNNCQFKEKKMDETNDCRR